MKNTHEQNVKMYEKKLKKVPQKEQAAFKSAFKIPSVRKIMLKGMQAR